MLIKLPCLQTEDNLKCKLATDFCVQNCAGVFFTLSLSEISFFPSNAIRLEGLSHTSCPRPLIHISYNAFLYTSWINCCISEKKIFQVILTIFCLVQRLSRQQEVLNLSNMDLSHFLAVFVSYHHCMISCYNQKPPWMTCLCNFRSKMF